MAKYRTVLLDAIKKISAVKPDKMEAAQKALDALIAVNLSASDTTAAELEFRNAVKDKAEFWNAHASDHGLTFSEEEGASEDISFQQLQQAASEQRVLMGLQTATDEILVTLLKNNPDQCRQYIAKQGFGTFLANEGWPKPDPGIDLDPAKNILTDASVIKIREQAALFALEKLIADATDAQLLKAVIDAKNKADFQAAVAKLSNASPGFKFPAGGADVLPDMLPEGLSDVAVVRYAPLALEQYVSRLDSTDLRSVARMEESAFKDWIQPKLGLDNIKEEHVVSIREQLILRSIQEYYKNRGNVYEDESEAVDLEVINGSDLEAIAEAIKGEVWGASLEDADDEELDDDEELEEDPELDDDDLQHFIEQAVTKEPSLFKAFLATNLIRDQGLANLSILEELANAPDVAKFQEGLGKLGIKPADWVSEKEKGIIVKEAVSAIKVLKKERLNELTDALFEDATPKIASKIRALADEKDLVAFKKLLTEEPFKQSNVDWVASTDMLGLQQEARNTLFDFALGRISTLGSDAHPNLKNALEALPVESQNKLLDDTVGHKLRVLLDLNESQLMHVFRPKLSEDIATIKALAKENARLAPFRQLENAALARALEQYKPRIDLTDDQVKMINLGIRAHSVQLIPSIIYGQEDVALRDAIQRAAKPIGDQQQINVPLLAIHNHEKTLPSQKAILEVFLRLDAGAKYTPTVAGIGEIFKALQRNPHSVQGFIDAIASNKELVVEDKEREHLKRALSLELSEMDYFYIQQQRRDELLKSGNEAYVVKAIVEVQESFNNIKTQQKTALDSASKLNSIIESKVFENGAMTFPAAFDEAVRSRPVTIKAEFDQLLTKAQAVVTHLETNKDMLESHLKIIDEHMQRLIVAKAEIDPDLKKLKSNLEGELKAVNAKLAKYKQAETQISKMVEQIDRVINGTRSDVYRPTGVTVSRCTHAELETMRANFARIDPGQVPVAASMRRTLEDATQEIGGAGELFVHEVVATTSEGKVTKGVFVQSFDLAEAPSITTSQGEQIRSPSCKIEVLQPPTFFPKPPAKPEASADKEDVANFYLDMALAMIVANGGKPPTKDNPVHLVGGTRKEMELLWTALKIIGSKTDLKFGEDAINIVSGPFLPSQVKGTFGFKDHSAYKTIFEGSAALEQKISEADEIASKAKKTSKALSDATIATHGFKEQFQSQKSTWQNLQQKIGVIPTSAVDVLNKVTDVIPTTPMSEAVTDLWSGLRK